MTVAELRKVLDEYDGGCPLAIVGQLLYVGEDGVWREVGRQLYVGEVEPESRTEGDLG